MKRLFIGLMLVASGCASAGVQKMNMSNREIVLGTSHYETIDNIGGYLADYGCDPKKIRMEPNDEINKFHRFYVECKSHKRDE